MSDKKMIKAVIFDMDGLLIDSEPFWQETEKKLFGELGVNVTPELHKQTFGFRIEEQIEFWYKDQPWKEKKFDEIKNRYQEIIIDFFKHKVELVDGAKYILDFFRKTKLQKALASSSDMILINTILEKFGLTDYFDSVYSAEYEGYGKPHPAVFLKTAQQLKVKPFECLVFEDSTNGVLAAKSAKMKTIAVPPDNNEHKNDPIYQIADMRLTNLKEFDNQKLQSFLS